MIKTFEIDDLIRIAKRENNTKRSYLYVNPVQGKHIPVSPSRSLELFSLLAQKIEDRYPDEGILIIGFAETVNGLWFSPLSWTRWAGLQEATGKYGMLKTIPI